VAPEQQDAEHHRHEGQGQVPGHEVRVAGPHVKHRPGTHTSSLWRETPGPLRPFESRLRDELPVNPPYEGLLAEAYDAWIPVDAVFPDDAVHEAVVRDGGGPALELGCGTGRPMLRFLAAGLDVEGLDSSADMLAICRRHAAERGLDPVLHHASMAPLDLGGTFATIFCPAGSFSLLDDPEVALEALASYRNHLRPGGALALTMSVPVDDFEARFEWRVHRTGTRPSDGTTFVVHEAVACDRAAQLQVIYNRVEAWDASGALMQSLLRRYHLRWWERAELEEVLTGLGFVDVHSLGDDAGWVALARRPG
jgi:SAM-dependent methyltransferase